MFNGTLVHMVQNPIARDVVEDFAGFLKAGHVEIADATRKNAVTLA